MKTRAVDFDGCNDEDEAKRGETTSDKIMKNEEEKLWKIYHPELEGLQIRRISAKKVAVFVGFAGWHPEKP